MSLRTMSYLWSEKGSVSGTTTPRTEIIPEFRRRRCGVPKLSFAKVLALSITSLVFVALLVGGIIKLVHRNDNRGQEHYAWQDFYRLNGFYNGVRTLVSTDKFVPDNRYGHGEPPLMLSQTGDYYKEKMPPMEPEAYNPYPSYHSAEYLATHEPVHTCYLDSAETITVPDVYVYPGVPQGMSDPSFGSYDALGLRKDVCFDRFGRLGPYGYGYNASMGGTGLGEASENTGSEKVFEQTGYVDYSNVDWGSAQKRCYEKNAARFQENQKAGKERVKRHAYILRTWTGYEYTEYQLLSLRAMVSELSLKSGGEYDVHFLVHVKDASIPIWASEKVYRETLEKNVPQEFWNISTLWSEKQMELYYPEPFPGNFANIAGSSIHGVYRSAHFPLQWFSQQHPEYDFFWNWEMDLRLTGHYYEFNNAIGNWGREQPRKGIWERSSRFYMPEVHGDWNNFTQFVEEEIPIKDAPKDIFAAIRSGPSPVWGPVHDFPHDEGNLLDVPQDNIPPHSYDEDKYEWGVGEDADLLTFNPLFDPSLTNWVFREDVNGYNTSLPVPPRRTAIITVARLSKKLLDTMHEETYSMKHTMFPEMWPPTVALHYGHKAAYVPHPVFFDRDWDMDYMNQIFNYPVNTWDSPFGWGEHNLMGSSFYYNSGFSSALWRRWLGQWENNEGGRAQEESGTGRMCLRSTLFHPVKHEHNPVE